ncbi:NPR2-domain-containing protein [Cylindrobasidium torrendii FP15055 ss-10]|uniref:NPR2-domain-containing protein n=1 Tax=Cylindrobasidium torrendii FP15055 ss-10 TaxID=1314674 RepID=A0A0D7BNK9_9AGAR|nr:NPR2-domain-containing protein [Cylindrobasidium torrendii FP15055 ss-10]
MPADGDSFLPRILSVFYAVFDNTHGPKIVYQVPEGLIAVPSASTHALPSVPPTPLSEAPQRLASRNSSTSLASPTDFRPSSRIFSSSSKRSTASQALFNFSDISGYVIPPSALCGRLILCSTGKHRVIGFPVELEGKYERNYFRYNLCFVFERGADLRCYEPVVRKVSRVLTSCEQESRFLSSPKTSPELHGILEQLYEELNSYSETSIPIDQFNSIELKIFPFYPNPPAVKDWMVPVALINVSKQIEDNWDLTMVKVLAHIDGVNHVSRIAKLAEVDIHYARKAIAHLLYYQVIMTIDIFQYSNMYTLSKSIQWLADQSHVKKECGPYVTNRGRNVPDWPKLLHLYSRMKPGRTVYEWMESYDVESLGIDVRRFTSFGVIKGFLRRVHRWPLYAPEKNANTFIHTRQRVGSATATTVVSDAGGSSSQGLLRGRASYTMPLNAFVSSETATSPPPTPSQPARGLLGTRPRRASAAEKVLEQVRNRHDHQQSIVHQPTSESPTGTTIIPTIVATSSTPLDNSPSSSKFGSVESRRHGFPVPPPSPIIGGMPARPRVSRSPSGPAVHIQTDNAGAAQPLYPDGLLPLLDGKHHTDELSVRFEVGWPDLERWLIAAGGGEEDGPFGSIVMIFQ